MDLIEVDFDIVQAWMLSKDNIFALLLLSSRRSGDSSPGFHAGSLLARKHTND